MPHAGLADSITNDGHGSWSDISDWSSSNPRHSSHQCNTTKPSYFFKFIHTSIRAFISYARASRMIRALNRPGARELSIARAAKCTRTLRVASRSGGCLIRHGQPTEPMEKTVDEHHAALAWSSRPGHLNLLVRS